jgi:hypothetical protein
LTKTRRDIATEYQVVIAALVPFAARGKLSVGLNKLKNRINKNDLEEIRYEVNRLITPSHEEADNSSFAKGKALNLKIDNVKLCLDAVGKRILKEELQRHNNSYTEGVCEAIKSPARYDQQVKKEDQQQKIEAFSVDCIQGNSELPLDKMMLIADFTVNSMHLNENATLDVHYLSKHEIAIELKTKPKLKKGDSLSFTFPALPQITEEPQSVSYHCVSVNSLPGRNLFAAVFKLERDDPWGESTEEYIRLNCHSFPLVAEQEEQRTQTQLLKDTIVSNMPICATLCEQKNNQLIPHTVLVSQGTQSTHIPSFNKVLFERLSNEFSRSRETYQFRYSECIHGAEHSYVANLGELIKDKMLGSFIHKGMSNKTLKVLKLTLVSTMDNQLAETETADNLKLPELQRFKYIIYSADVSCELSHFVVCNTAKGRPIPAHYKQNDDSYPVEVCMPDHCNLRTEPRYKFAADVKLKSNWFKSSAGNILDISSRGLKVKIDDANFTLKQQVAVSIPSFELSNIKYNVVSHDNESNEVHLAMTDKSNDKFAERVAKILDHNASHFDPSGLQRLKEPLFNYMWDIVSKTVPGVHILLGQGKSAKQQLIIAQTDGQQKSLAPFKLIDSRLPTHGWFANKDSTDLNSQRLSDFMQENADPQRSMFYINKREGSYTSLSEGALDNEDIRLKMRNAISLKKAQLVAHTMQAANYNRLDDSWYEKRCQHLEVVDKSAIERIKKQETNFARILSVIPVSMLHQFLLPVGEFDSSANTDDF